MKKYLPTTRYFLFAIVILMCAGRTNGQIVFTDNCNRGTFTTGGSPSLTYNVANGAITMVSSTIASMRSTAAAGATFTSGPIAGFSAPFNATLSSNSSLLTWTFNMQTNTPVTALPASGTVSGGVDLMSDAGASILSGGPNGYAVMFNPGANGGVELVKFTSGMAAAGCTILIAPGSVMSKTNYFSVRVTYDPPTNLWSLYVRDDGASAFADPASGVTSLIGTATDNTYTGTALTRFGFLYGYTAGTAGSKIMQFDNFSIGVAPTIAYTALSSLVCATGNQTLNATVSNAPTTGVLMPRVYFKKNSGSWFSNAGTFVSGTTYNFTINAATMGGLALGDVVSYYIIAQDAAGYNIYSKPYTGLVASTVNAVTTPPTTPNTYTVSSVPSSVSATAGLACLGQNLSLTGFATNGITYAWSGPSSFSSTLQSPTRSSITAGAAGIYTFTATNPCGSTVATTASVTVNASPTITVTPTSGSVCPGSFRSLTASGGLSYTWAPSTGLSASTGANVTATPTITTTYTVTGTSASCFGTATAALTFTTTPFSVSAVATPTLTCVGGSTTLTAAPLNTTYNTLTSIPYSLVTMTSPTSIANGTWVGSADDGYVTVALPFTYYFYGTAYTSVNICTNGFVNFGTPITTYSTFTLPSASAPGQMVAIFYRDLSPQANTVSYSFEGTAPNRKFVVYYNGVRDLSTTNFNYGQIVLYETSNYADVIITAAGSTAASVKVCGVQNAAGTSAVAVPGENNVSYQITTPEAWRFSGVPTGVTYAWSPSASLTATTGISVYASPLSSTTTYSVIATETASGCSAITGTTITVGPLTGTISGPSSICDGASTTFTITGPATDTAVYTINGGTPTEVSLGATGTAIISTGTLSSATVYQLTTIKSGVCSSVITGQTITISINPAAGPITGTTPICVGASSTYTDGVGGGTWATANSAVASVNSSGVVFGIGTGATTISYTVGSCPTATSSVVVNAVPGAITPGTAVTLCVGASTTLANATSGGTWYSGDITIADVNSSTGIVTAYSPGIVNISYTNGCGTDPTKTVTVNTTPDVITGIAFDPAPAAVCTLSVYNSFTNTVGSGTWSNSPTTVGTINSSTGVFTATTTTGTTVLTYTIGSCSVTASLNVGNTSPAPITGTTTVCATSTVTLADATPSGVWISDNTSIATVNPVTGAVRGVNAGTTIISYDNGCGTPATQAFTVNGSTLVLSTDTACSGTTFHLYATLAAAGTYAWTGPNSFTSTLQNPTIANVTTNAAGTYSFTTTSTVGSCLSTGQVFGIVDQIPTVTVTASPSTICEGGTSALSDVVNSPTAFTMYAIPYSAVSITGTAGPTNDDQRLLVTIPFTFNFYGVNYTQCRISSNGFINFGANAGTAFTPFTLPSASAPEAMIALFWHDMNPSVGGSVTYTTLGSSPNRRFVVSYNATADASGTGTNSGQIILYETTNMIDLMVARTSGSVAYNRVCGVQNVAGTSALTAPGQNNVNYTKTGPGEGWRFVTPSYNYAWSPSATLSNSAVSNPSSVGLTASETFTVVTSDEYSSCTGKVSTVNVTVNADPTVASVTESSTDLCTGGTITLTAGTVSGGAGSFSSYIWVGPGGYTNTVSSIGTTTVAASPTVTGVYSVYANYSGSGCTGVTPALSSTINVVAQPTVTSVTPSSTNLCFGSSVTLTSVTGGGTGTPTYTWSGPAITTTTSVGGTSPVFTPTLTGISAYSLTIGYSGTGCNNATNSANVTLNATPAITLGAMPSICTGTTGPSVSYTGGVGSPTLYDLVWSAAAHTALFNDVSAGGLSGGTSGSITLAVPVAAPEAVYTGTLTVSTSACSGNNYPVNVTVYAYPTASITSAIDPCMGNSTNLEFTGTPGAVVNYTIDGGSGINATLNAITGIYNLPLSSVTSSHTYNLVNAHNPACTNAIGTSATINPIPQQWVGGTPSHLNDWNTAANWTCGTVPVLTDDVTIVSGYTYAPEIATSASGTTRNLIVKPGLSLVLNSGATLNVKGTLGNAGTISGTGTVVMNGAVAQAMDSTGSVDNLEIDNTSGVTIHSGSMVTIIKELTMTSGNLATGGNLALASSDTFASARIAPIASGATISGSINVQQYIQGGYRRFRFWSHPFNASMSLSQLQNSIDITGVGGSVNGFRTTGSNAPSAFRYDPTTANSSSSYDPGWKPYTNITPGADDSNKLKRYQGIRLFLRGAKNEGIGYWFTYTPSDTIIGMTGAVNQGTQTITLTKGIGSDQDYNMVGNPYPSPVDIGTVLHNALVSGDIVGSAFYVWNPSIGASGMFQAIPINTVSATPYYLPAYSAFQVRAATNGSTITVAETDKANNASNYLFKAPSDIVSLHVYDANYHLWDELSFRFSDDATEQEDRVLDARKLLVSDFSFYSLSSDQKKLVIDSRPYNAEKVIPMGISSAYAQEYIIKAENVALPAGSKLYLHDKLLQKYVALEAGSEYRFAITKDKNTQGENRFEISMKPAAVAPVVSGLHVTMTPNPATDDVQIKFTSGKEDNVSVRVLDMSGVSVYNTELGLLQSGAVNVPLGSLASGVYMVEITSGNQKVIQRLVKE